MTGRVVVTGASGFVGSHLVGTLVDNGWTVDAISRSMPGRQEGPIRWLRMPDTADALAPLLIDTDVVVHLAAAVSGSRDASVSDAELVDSNVRLGAVLLEAMRLAGISRLVNTSTIWKYRDATQLMPANRYAATKVAFEVLIDHAVACDGLEAVTLELADTYGPGDTRPKLIPLLLTAAREETHLALGSREQRMAPVHIDDVVGGFVDVIGTLLDTGLPVGHRRHSLMPDETTTVGTVVTTLHELTGGRPKVDFDALAPIGAGPQQLGSPRPGPPGWRPRIGLRAGLDALWQKDEP